MSLVGGVTYYKVFISYSYVVDGVVNWGCNYSFSDCLSFDSEKRCDEFVNDVKLKKYCYYSRKNPKYSVLSIKYSAGDGSSYLAMLLSGLALIAFAVHLNVIFGFF